MKVGEFYQPQGVAYPFRGLNTLAPSPALLAGECPDCLNVHFRDNIVESRYGFAAMGAPLDIGMVIVEFVDAVGTVHIVMITPTKQYQYTGGAWADITGDTWTGTFANPVSWTIGADATGTRWLIITNGKDTPQKWSGEAATFVDLAVNIANFVTCKTVTVFETRLFLGGVQTTDVMPNDVAWSIVGNFEDFTGVGSGISTLADAEGAIEWALMLNGRLIFYLKGSIVSTVYVGGDNLFAFDTVVRGVRLLNPRCVTDLGDAHLIATEDNIYRFSGGRVLEPIGDPIRNTFQDYVLSVLGTIQTAFAAFDPVKGRAFVVITTSTFGKIFVVDVCRTCEIQQKWSIFEVGRVFSIGFLWSLRKTLWSVYSGGAATWLESTSYLDNASYIASRWVSKDFFAPEEYISSDNRWIELELELRRMDAGSYASGVKVTYSTDLGANYVSPSGGGILALGTAWTRHKVFVDLVSKTIRFKIETTGTDLQRGGWEMRWFKVWGKSEADR